MEQAQQLRFDDWSRVLAYWSLSADPDGAERDARELVERRRAHLSQTFGGVWVGELVFDPIGGAIVDAAWREIERVLYEAVTACASERTAAQRRADAWVEMAIRARTAPAGGRRPAPLFSVVVGLETLTGPVCELANGTPLTPGALVPWLDAAYVERVVFGGGSRVIDVGERQRLFTGATRRAVEVRDRNRCFHPTCTATDHLQADHIVPYRDGGPTVQSNGRIACGYHNRRRNDDETNNARDGPAP